MATPIDSLESPKIAAVLTEFEPEVAELIQALVRDVQRLAAYIEELQP